MLNDKDLDMFKTYVLKDTMRIALCLRKIRKDAVVCQHLKDRLIKLQDIISRIDKQKVVSQG